MKTMQTNRARGGFSLAEMMIALVILGFGLLVIGAALPVGLNYSRQTIDLVTGEQAAQYALDVVERQVRLKGFENPSNTGVPTAPANRRVDDVFRSRGPNNELEPYYEPRIKVRPFLVEALLSRSANPNNFVIAPIESKVEQRIGNWLTSQYGAAPGSLAFEEVDLRRTMPSFSARSVVFPPLDTYDFGQQATDDNPGRSFFPTAFNPAAANSNGGWSFMDPNLAYRQEFLGDLEKLRGRNLVWVAFYRRASYGSPGNEVYPGSTISTGVRRMPPAMEAEFPGLSGAGGDDVAGDASLYEVIIVVMRVPSPAHRFAAYDLQTWEPAFDGRLSGGGVPRLGALTVAPQPMLVGFVDLPLLNPLAPNPPFDGTSLGRELTPFFVPDATLRFVASPAVGALLLPGSVFIPAVNDHRPNLNAVFAQAAGSALHPPMRAGFVPHAPNALPIYRVVQRRVLDDGSGNVEVLVEYNGFHPWVYDPNRDLSLEWPVWVIPEPFVDVSSQTGAPQYEDRSAVVAVARRFIRFTEVE